jgi:hypothetical protein
MQAHGDATGFTFYQWFDPHDLKTPIVSTSPPPEFINLPVKLFLPNRVPFPIFYSLTVGGSAGAKGHVEVPGHARSDSAVFFGDFIGTLSWGGISSAKNKGTGEALTNFSLTSASGFDYTQAFVEPEPSGAKLALTAVALVVAPGLAQRRRLVAMYRRG